MAVTFVIEIGAMNIKQRARPLTLTVLVMSQPGIASAAEDPFAPLAQGRAVSAVLLLDSVAQTAPDRIAGGGPSSRLYDTARALAPIQVAGVAVARAYHRFPMAQVTLASPRDFELVLHHPNVLAVFPNETFDHFLTQSLPLVNQPLAYSLGYGGEGATVAVLDTGVDYTRAEFGPCTAPATPAGSCKVVYAADVAPDDGLRDANGHGTNVGGVVVGVAPQTKLAALDVFDGNIAYTTDLLEGIQWAIDNQATYNIVALNLSLGAGKFTGPCDNPLTNALVTPIAEAYAAGIVTVAASGNNGYIDGIASPACVSLSVSVGAVYDANLGSQSWGACTDATTASDRVACFSNSATYLDLLAPGASIIAGGYVASGTSQAAPHAAGALAILRSVYSSEPQATTVSRLAESGKPITDPRNGVTLPRMDVIRAVGSVNDDFSQRATLDAAAGTLTAVNYSASLEAQEPAHAGQTGGSSVWWSWTAASSGWMTIDTFGSDIDTLLAAYTGPDLSNLTEIASNDDVGSVTTSSITFAAVAGQSYVIAVDGKNGASGVIQMHWTLDPTNYSIAEEDIPLLPPWAMMALAGGLLGSVLARKCRRKKNPGPSRGR